MATKKYKPTSPGLRHKQGPSFDEITKTTPEKSLLKVLKKSAGRNNTGRITVRHKGGGTKRKYRVIDFSRKKYGITGVVRAIEYDPNRTSYIALIVYNDGAKGYIIAPEGLNVGDAISSGESSEIRTGNTLPLQDIPLGSLIHNIELFPNRGGQLVRSAGASATLMAKNNRYATVKLPSGEVRLVLVVCKATLGVVGNADHRNTRLSKAGDSRHRGIRPTVRGSVMNACDHVHGGGEGRAPIGRPSPYTAYGKKATLKTRNKKNRTTKMIVRRRR